MPIFSDILSFVTTLGEGLEAGLDFVQDLFTSDEAGFSVAGAPSEFGESAAPLDFLFPDELGGDAELLSALKDDGAGLSSLPGDAVDGGGLGFGLGDVGNFLKQPQVLQTLATTGLGVGQLLESAENRDQQARLTEENREFQRETLDERQRFAAEQNELQRRFQAEQAEKARQVRAEQDRLTRAFQLALNANRGSQSALAALAARRPHRS